MRPAGRAARPPREFARRTRRATTGRRLGSWATTRDAVNSVWYQSADQLVARSRDIARKDGWAAKAIDEWVCNAIGNGIKPQSLHPDQATKEKIQKLWSQFANECDAAGMTDFYGLEALAFRSMVEGGECFVAEAPADDGLGPDGPASTPVDGGGAVAVLPGAPDSGDAAGQRRARVD